LVNNNYVDLKAQLIYNVLKGENIELPAANSPFGSHNTN